jgi:peptide subunit release factor 1 (eRF1)
MLGREQKTASNIKDKTTRKDVQKALSAIQERLRMIKKIPENGLAIYAGWGENRSSAFDGPTVSQTVPSCV